MERAYREDELLDASVIDSEGYIYGKVEKINIKENEITLTVQESKPDVRTVVDIANLESEFLKRVKLTVSENFSDCPPRMFWLRILGRNWGLNLEQLLQKVPM